MAIKIQEHEEEIILLRKHLADYSVKVKGVKYYLSCDAYIFREYFTSIFILVTDNLSMFLGSTNTQ